jgi:hypothetical protein
MMMMMMMKNQFSLSTFRMRYTCMCALENTLDVLDTQHKGPFLWCIISDYYDVISFVFDVPPLTYRLVSTTLFTFVAWLLCSLNCMFRLVYSHRQFCAYLLHILLVVCVYIYIYIYIFAKIITQTYCL